MFVQGDLKGVATAKDRLKEQDEDSEPGDLATVKTRIQELLDYLHTNPKEAHKLRTAEGGKHFDTFLDFFLIHMVKVVTWKTKAGVEKISEIFTISDEALALLLIENNLHDYREMCTSGQNVDRKNSKPKYTKKIGNFVFQGWHWRGISRYNELWMSIKKERREQACILKEENLMQEYSDVLNPNDNMNLMGGMEELDGDAADIAYECIDAIDVYNDMEDTTTGATNRAEV